MRSGQFLPLEAAGAAEARGRVAWLQGAQVEIVALRHVDLDYRGLGARCAQVFLAVMVVRLVNGIRARIDNPVLTFPLPVHRRTGAILPLRAVVRRGHCLGSRPRLHLAALQLVSGAVQILRHPRSRLVRFAARLYLRKDLAEV